MSRLILILALIAVLTLVAAMAVSVMSEAAERGERSLSRPGGRLNAVQRVAYVLLLAVMAGTATGWLGTE